MARDRGLPGPYLPPPAAHGAAVIWKAATAGVRPGTPPVPDGPSGVPAPPLLPRAGDPHGARPAAGHRGVHPGREMTDANWQAGSAKSLAAFLNGDSISEPEWRAAV